MIPNHARFIEAINEKKKVRVRLYSVADNGVVDRVCAPMDYGLGVGNQDGLNRYWLWDYTSKTGSHHCAGHIGYLHQHLAFARTGRQTIRQPCLCCD